ncbi:hypothetical protein CCACVL1_25309 [Corchorus capsularis]|uniref:PGG domain-containing protein n=1 Tax=Corchorus capsularis TaxID=210143 RepID=A0A1R3GLA5_COCAP|nr:hypothetical protein CCACVL1_25309 [Corchorus capsularis]
MDADLRQCAEAGNTDSLYRIIQGNEKILDKIDQQPFTDTPLHVIASLQAIGDQHMTFALELMNLKPSLARKLNLEGYSPVHLALQSNHTGLVLQLIAIDGSLVRVKSRGGITPFHYVVERGNLQLVTRFLKECPECVQDVTVEGRTALHIATENDNNAAFEAIMGNIEGNTVLHVAATRNQAQVIRRLMQFPVDKNAKNAQGETAVDIIRRERQVNNVVFRIILWCLAVGSLFINNILFYFSGLRRIMVLQYENMPGDRRSALLVVAGLIITATYNASLNPPGGVWTPDYTSASMNITTSYSTQNGTINAAPEHKLGTTVMDEAYLAYKHKLLKATAGELSSEKSRSKP